MCTGETVTERSLSLRYFLYLPHLSHITIHYHPLPDITIHYQTPTTTYTTPRWQLLVPSWVLGSRVTLLSPPSLCRPQQAASSGGGLPSEPSLGYQGAGLHHAGPPGSGSGGESHVDSLLTPRRWPPRAVHSLAFSGWRSWLGFMKRKTLHVIEHINIITLEITLDWLLEKIIPSNSRGQYKQVK